MWLFSWAENGMKKLKWYDISLFKLSVAAFILMVAKLWAPILSLDWYWYGIIFVVLTIYLLFKMFGE
jgi:hypothetical protein